VLPGFRANEDSDLEVGSIKTLDLHILRFILGVRQTFVESLPDKSVAMQNTKVKQIPLFNFTHSSIIHGCHIVSLLFTAVLLTLLSSANTLKHLVPFRLGRSVLNDSTLPVTTHNALLSTREKL